MNGALQSCLYHDRRTCSGLGRLHNESVALKRGTTGLRMNCSVLTVEYLLSCLTSNVLVIHWYDELLGTAPTPHK